MSVNTAEDLYEMAKQLPSSDRLRLVEKIAHDLQVQDKEGEARRDVNAAGGQPFTVADLLDLLAAAPRPDDAFFDEVESLTQNQPSLPSGPWQR